MLSEGFQDEPDRGHINVKRIVIPTLVVQGLGFFVLGVYSIFGSLGTPDPYGGLYIGLSFVGLLIGMIPIGASINFRKFPTPIGVVFIWCLFCVFLGISSIQATITWNLDFNPLYLLYLVPGVVGLLGTLYIGLGQKRQDTFRKSFT